MGIEIVIEKGINRERENEKGKMHNESEKGRDTERIRKG
jgi:hypothetical protein